MSHHEDHEDHEGRIETFHQPQLFLVVRHDRAFLIQSSMGGRPRGGAAAVRAAGILACSGGSRDVLSLANMIHGRPKTPYKSPRELHEMGFDTAVYCIGPLLAGRAVQQRYFDIVGRGMSVMQSLEAWPRRWLDGFNVVIGREQAETWNTFFCGK